MIASRKAACIDTAEFEATIVAIISVAIDGMSFYLIVNHSGVD